MTDGDSRLPPTGRGTNLQKMHFKPLRFFRLSKSTFEAATQGCLSLSNKMDMDDNSASSRACSQSTSEVNQDLFGSSLAITS